MGEGGTYQISMGLLVHLSPILESTSPFVLAFHPFSQLPIGVYELEYGGHGLWWFFPEISPLSLSLLSFIFSPFADDYSGKWMEKRR
jgi:hypothetical protein